MLFQLATANEKNRVPCRIIAFRFFNLNGLQMSPFHDNKNIQLWFIQNIYRSLNNLEIFQKVASWPRISGCMLSVSLIAFPVTQASP